MTFTDDSIVKFSKGCTECSICGKKFYVQSRSVYSYKMRNGKGIMKYMCSYSCYNKALEVKGTKFVPTPLW